MSCSRSISSSSVIASLLVVVEDMLAFRAPLSSAVRLESAEHHLLVARRWDASNGREKCCEG